jgi:predicted aspartyl protease
MKNKFQKHTLALKTSRPHLAPPAPAIRVRSRDSQATSKFRFNLKRCRFCWWMQLALLATCAPAWADPQTSAAPSQVEPTVVVVPFEFSRERIMVPARVNGSEPLSFMLDTGFSITTVHPDLAQRLNLGRAGHVTIVGIAGEEEAEVFEGARFDLGGATYSPRRVAAVPSDSKRASRKRGGVLGAGFFKRFVVEIDPKAKTLKLHEPKSFKYTGSGESIPFKFKKDTPVVEASINIPGRAAVPGRFEIDTGCDGGLCLGHDFVEAHRLVESAGQTEGSVRQGLGGAARTTLGRVPQLQLGRLTIDKPQANFFLQGSPVERGLAGHIGLEVLRQFKVILDYSHQQMILEPYR